MKREIKMMAKNKNKDKTVTVTCSLWSSVLWSDCSILQEIQTVTNDCSFFQQLCRNTLVLSVPSLSMQELQEEMSQLDAPPPLFLLAGRFSVRKNVKNRIFSLIQLMSQLRTADTVFNGRRDHLLHQEMFLWPSQSWPSQTQESTGVVWVPQN